MTARPDNAHVLLVEDDASLRLVFTTELQRMGFTVTALVDANNIVDALRTADPDVVVLDLHLPGRSGMDVLPLVLQQDTDLPVIVCTGHGTVDLAVRAMREGAFDFLTKPLSLDLLEQTVRRAATHHALLLENRRLRVAPAAVPGSGIEIEGKSAAARQFARALERIAASHQSVLLVGESGSGKELAARRLHALSPRRDGPFVVVNCGAMPRSLLESELFGHLKGAFTGADQKRPGLFDAANGGTLFLDEVGELPLELQPALLRAVQFGEIRPVGSNQVHRVDVRLLAATHRDLHEWIRDGRFREDLYYRIAVLELQVPPLRERVDDIPDLARAFLRREASRAGRVLQWADAALQRLQRHDWPGNVRELENAVVRIGVLADGPTITAADVERIALRPRPQRTAGADEATTALPTIELHALEALAIEEALRRSGGNKRRAAKALGIAVKTLYNKLHADAGPADTDPPATD